MFRIAIKAAILIAVCTLFRTSKLAAADEKPASGSAIDPIFETSVLPILKAKCVQCHGERVQKSELNLSSPEGVLKGSSSGPIISAGKPDESLLLQVLHEGLMPPPNEGTPLTAAESEMLHHWVESGAHFASPGAASQSAVTEREISRLMLLRCAVCHNGRVREGGLDLRTRESMLVGGKSGPAIDLEHPEDSLILKKIRAGEMPPLRKLASVSIKVIEPAEVETLLQWIKSGAPAASPPSETETVEADSEVSAEDRQFWSFQPPRPQSIPAIRSQDRVRNPIDAFVLQKLEVDGLSLSPEADRRTLIRRAHFDLTGLPPTPEDVAAFVNDSDPEAWEKLIDRLLASRHYGERWGRYWLDLAGYSDSDGVNEDDPIRPYAYRYRDYVIRSLNNDKPYDRFLLEQVAGDELADYENAAEMTDEIFDNLVATGFLRMGPDGTYNGLTNYVPDRLEVIASEVEVLTSSVMGLTLKCARCHAHKFDPIPHRDYYQLTAIFKGALDENDWLRPAKVSTEFPLRGLKYSLPGEKERWETEQKQLKDKIDELQRIAETRHQELVRIQLEKNIGRLQDILHEDVRAAVLAPQGQRTEVQKYLATKFEQLLEISSAELGKLDPEFRALMESTFRQVKVLKDQLNPNEPYIQALWDRGEPTATYILRRGSYLSPGKAVDPGVPSVLADAGIPFAVEPPWPGAKQTGRRLAFARWLVHPDHPLTSRVMVNRLWKHHFLNGIVRSLDNFGRAGQPPSHPELLDWLAIEFVRNGWSMKSMHRLMMNSATYRQTSQLTDEHSQHDPENRLLSRFPLRRLDAESLRDSLLFVSGSLNDAPFGPPERVEIRSDGLVSSIGSDKGWRRSIYVLQRRSQTSSILEDFDLPQMAPNCVERTIATVTPQALHLLNNRMVHHWATAMADRIDREVGVDRDAQIGRAFELALGRSPDAAELELTISSFEELKKNWRNQIEKSGVSTASTAGSAQDSEETISTEEQSGRESLTNLCHALMNSAEFIYVD